MWIFLFMMDIKKNSHGLRFVTVLICTQINNCKIKMINCDDVVEKNDVIIVEFRVNPPAMQGSKITLIVLHRVTKIPTST